MLAIDVDKFDKADPDHAEARQKAKALNFGIIFGSGPNGLREFAQDGYGISLTVDEARQMIERFLKMYNGVANWMDLQERRARRDGWIDTVGGRHYSFEWEVCGRFSRNLAFNLPIQGTAAEIAVEAVIRIDARLRRDLPAGKLLLQVHDEFVLEVPSDCEELAERIREQLGRRAASAATGSSLIL
jgi:DNA polymerase-1